MSKVFLYLAKCRLQRHSIFPEEPLARPLLRMHASRYNTFQASAASTDSPEATEASEEPEEPKQF